MITAFEKQFEVEATGGQDNFIDLKFPPRGEIGRFIVTQISGSVDGFTADLFSSERVKNAGSSSSASHDGADSPEVYRILPTLTAADTVEKAETFDVEHPYRNQDGTPTNPVKKLYLKLRPGGTGVKQFQVALAARLPG